MRRLGACLLVLCAVSFDLGRSVAGSCDSGIHYDTQLPNAIADRRPGLWAQLFEVPRVPWRFTSVCLLMYSDAGGTVTVNVSWFSPIPDPVTGLLRPGPLLWTQPVTLDVPAKASPATTYQSVEVSFVSWGRRVFVGPSFDPTDPASFRTGAPVAASTGKTMVYVRLGLQSTWKASELSAINVRATGEVVTSVSAADGWTCDPLTFGDGKKCDCNCGREDPDCVYVSRTSDLCRPTEICLGGTCVRHGWDPSLQNCALNTIDADQLCQCGCGTLVDPDCRVPYVPSSSGTCSLWSPCNRLKFSDRKTCDCECGLYDPDCDNFSLPVVGCADSTMTCAYHVGNCIVRECNNGRIDPGEACDGGNQCSECHCRAHYVPTDPPSRDCRTDCGDGFLTPEEQCDASPFCDHPSCTCQTGHSLLPNTNGICSGCGNKMVDGQEECDGEEGCLGVSCLCAKGYVPREPRALGCAAAPVSNSGSRSSAVHASGNKGKNTTLYVIIGAAGGALLLVLAIVAAVVVTALMLKKRNSGDDKQVVMLTLPVETGYASPPQLATPNTYASSGMGQYGMGYPVEESQTPVFMMPPAVPVFSSTSSSGLVELSCGPRTTPGPAPPPPPPRQRPSTSSGSSLSSGAHRP